MPLYDKDYFAPGYWAYGYWHENYWASFANILSLTLGLEMSAAIDVTSRVSNLAKNEFTPLVDIEFSSLSEQLSNIDLETEIQDLFAAGHIADSELDLSSEVSDEEHANVRAKATVRIDINDLIADLVFKAIHRRPGPFNLSIAIYPTTCLAITINPVTNLEMNIYPTTRLTMSFAHAPLWHSM